MDSVEEYVILLDLLCRVNNANEDLSSEITSDGERLLDAHFLANKFISHALTVLHLFHKTRVQDLPSFKSLSFTDSASIDVLTRAAMEAFLTFHYVFSATDIPEEKEYRYLSYKAAGLAERQSLPATTEEHRSKLDEEKDCLDKLRVRLESNEIYQNLSNNQKKQIFRGRGGWRWRPNGEGGWSWGDIAIDAGFSRLLAEHMYRHLCGHAHSSSLSVLQWQQALVNKELEQLARPSVDIMKVLVANMIQEYCGLFSRAQDVLMASEASESVRDWVDIGRRLDENLDMDSD